MKLRRELVAFAAGVVFAAGLALARMTQPSKVLAFLDVAGAWDPSLAFVMAAAVAVSAVAFALAARRRAPVLDDRFHFPPRSRAVDGRLVLGAALFGIGWGLSGLCPGPAVTLLVTGDARALVFALAMLAGTVTVDLAGRALRPQTSNEIPSR